MSESNGLPEGWTAARLAEMAAVVRGISFPKDAKKEAPFANSIVCLRTTNVQREVDWSDIWHVPRQHVGREEQLVRLHDILISTANSLELVGKVALVRELRVEATLGAFISLIRAKPGLSAQFLYYQMATQDVQQQLRATASTTTNISNISTKKVVEAELRVAPLNEQRRIVEKIEELFSDLDAGIAALERAKANLKRYRASVLKAAVEGSLTAEWSAKHRNVEPASKLLERILKERRRKWEGDQLAKFAAAGKQPPKNWQEKYVEPVAPERTNLPELPDNWCWASLDQVCKKITDGEHLSPTTTGSGVMLLSAKDVRDHGVVVDDPQFVSNADAHRFRERCDPELHDVLVVSRGATIGRTGIVQIPTTFCLMGSVILLKCAGHAMDSKLLALSLKERRCQRSLIAASGSTAQQAIYLRDIRSLAVALPPSGEQQQIVAVVEEKLSEIEGADIAIENGLLRAARLRQSILKQAFEGKLVPQDPSDEPAGVLLERIGAGRDRQKVGNTRNAAVPQR